MEPTKPQEKMTQISDAPSDLSLGPFEIEDITDLDMFAPLQFPSSCSSTSVCCG